MSKPTTNIGLEDNYKNFTVDINEELASQLCESERDTGVPPEVIAAAILTSHVEKGSLDVTDLRDT
tara:strand:+ start:210 stop:407 length:198 start_codon:yes stop_codon:yes gene_type:complete